MKQQRYYAAHHDSQSTGLEPSTSQQTINNGECRNEASPSSLRRRQRELPPFVEPGPQAGDLSTLRFLEPRRLRRLDVDGPSPLLLTLNGSPIDVVRPGENTFDPPVPLHPGDVLRLEALETDCKSDSDRLTGWTPPVSSHFQPGQNH